MQILGSEDSFVAAPLWQMLELPFSPNSPACQAMLDMAMSSRGGDFQVRGCRVAGAPSRGLFTLTFRSCFSCVVCNSSSPPGARANMAMVLGSGKELRTHLQHLTVTRLQIS